MHYVISLSCFEIYTAFAFLFYNFDENAECINNLLQVEIHFMDYRNVELSLAVGLHTKTSSPQKRACAKGIISWGERAVHTIAALLFQRWEVCTLIWSWESMQEDISYTGFIVVQWNWQNSVCDSHIHTCFSKTQDN